MYVCHFFMHEGVVIDTKDSDIQSSIVYLIKKNIHIKDCTLGKKFESIHIS